MSRLLGAVVLLLGESLTDPQIGFDEDHISVGGVMEVYLWWDLYEQDLLVKFHNIKVVALIVIKNGVILHITTERKYVDDVALIKLYHHVAF